MTDEKHTAHVLLGMNAHRPMEPSIGAIILSENVAQTAVEELNEDGPYDADSNPYWEADDDAPWRRWGFGYPRDKYMAEERPLHREQ